MIETIIQIIETATGLEMKPLHTSAIEDCIVYTEYVTADDGAKARHRLELRLITQTYASAEAYKPLIISALVNLADKMEIDGILNSELNGGGVLFDEGTKTIHTIMYFEYITRSLKE